MIKKKYKVILINKATREESLYCTCNTEAEAEHYCEEWGWSYDDGYHSYWMDILEEEEIISD